MSSKSNPDLFYTNPQFQAFFKKSNHSVLVKANPPNFIVLAVSDYYLNISYKQREELLNRNLFEVFPGGSASDPNDPLSVFSSFKRVIERKETDIQDVFRYDLFVPASGKCETYYWSNVNEPVLGEDGEVAYIIHSVTDVTAQVLQEQALTDAQEKIVVLEREQQMAQELARVNEELKAINLELQRAQDKMNKLNLELEQRIASRTRSLMESEAKYRAVIDQSPAAIIIFRGKELVVEMVNSAMLNILGKTPDIVGMPLLEAIPELEGQPAFDALSQVYSSGESITGYDTLVVLKRNGREETAYFNFTYTPLIEDGKIVGIIDMAMEVTDQVLSHKKLEESEKRLQTILETMAEGVGITDKHGKLVYVNRTAEEIVGLKKEELLTLFYDSPKFLNLRPDGSPLPTEEHPVSIALRTGRPVFDTEIAVERPGKERFYISLNAAPLRDEEGNITGGIGTFIDVTERRKAAQLKDEFISTVSHELKTPVTSLKAYGQILKRTLINTVNQSFLQRMEAQILRLEHLIKDLLDIARVDSGKLDLKQEEFRADIFIEELIRDLQLVSPIHQIIIEERAPLNVTTDPYRLSQVVTNLINNAIKYSPSADKVLVKLIKKGDKMVFSVKDFGVGISKESSPFVFERFHQASAGGYNLGLGLGLYISKEIITKSGGDIWFESEAGKGSTFYFSLPLSE